MAPKPTLVVTASASPEKNDSNAEEGSFSSCVSSTSQPAASTTTFDDVAGQSSSMSGTPSPSVSRGV